MTSANASSAAPSRWTRRSRSRAGSPRRSPQLITPGIVHRDLKPANIKVRPDGEVKVLDFGLAKSTAGLAGPTATNSDLDAATIASPAMTHAGVILGTAAYLAPEQAKGRAVDRRADLWAFGCVVFEMLAGRRAFDGESVTEVLASVLTREPEWNALPQHTPDSIRRLLRRCLQKGPKQRLHDIADARLEIDDAVATPSPTIRARGPAWWALAAGGALLVALGLALGWLARLPEPTRETVRPQRLTDMVGLEETPALAPDGRSLAFTAGVNGQRQVFVQLLEGGAPLKLTHDDSDHQFPRWTPAGNSVVYFSPVTPGDSQGTLWEIPGARYGLRHVYTEMVARSLVLWRAHQAHWTLPVLHEIGVMYMAPAVNDAQRASMKALTDANLPFEQLTGRAARARYPQVNFEGLDSIILEQQAGYLSSRLACQSVAKTFERLGGRYRTTSAGPPLHRSVTAV